MSNTATIDGPAYGASPAVAIRRYFQKYAVFHGRASRSEFWWVQLAIMLVAIVLIILAAILGVLTSPDGGAEPGWGLIPPMILYLLLILGVVVPQIAVTVRRLHDVNLSGWFFLLSFIPFGSMVVLIMTILPPNPLGARFDA